jgi:hypothetical protein
MLNKTLIILVASIVILSGLSAAYICINPQEDNEQVKIFKTNLNYLALKNDFDSGLTEEQIFLKIKYFNRC